MPKISIKVTDALRHHWDSGVKCSQRVVTSDHPLPPRLLSYTRSWGSRSPAMTPLWWVRLAVVVVRAAPPLPPPPPPPLPARPRPPLLGLRRTEPEVCLRCSRPQRPRTTWWTSRRRRSSLSAKSTLRRSRAPRATLRVGHMGQYVGRGSMDNMACWK